MNVDVTERAINQCQKLLRHRLYKNRTIHIKS